MVNSEVAQIAERKKMMGRTLLATVGLLLASAFFGTPKWMGNIVYINVVLFIAIYILSTLISASNAHRFKLTSLLTFLDIQNRTFIIVVLLAPIFQRIFG